MSTEHPGPPIAYWLKDISFSTSWKNWKGKTCTHCLCPAYLEESAYSGRSWAPRNICRIGEQSPLRARRLHWPGKVNLRRDGRDHFSVNFAIFSWLLEQKCSINKILNDTHFLTVTFLLPCTGLIAKAGWCLNRGHLAKTVPDAAKMTWVRVGCALLWGSEWNRKYYQIKGPNTNTEENAQQLPLISS